MEPGLCLEGRTCITVGSQSVMALLRPNRRIVTGSIAKPLPGTSHYTTTASSIVIEENKLL